MLGISDPVKKGTWQSMAITHFGSEIAFLGFPNLPNCPTDSTGCSTNGQPRPCRSMIWEFASAPGIHLWLQGFAPDGRAEVVHLAESGRPEVQHAARDGKRSQWMARERQDAGR